MTIKLRSVCHFIQPEKSKKEKSRITLSSCNNRRQKVVHKKEPLLLSDLLLLKSAVRYGLACLSCIKIAYYTEGMDSDLHSTPLLLF